MCAYSGIRGAPACGSDLINKMLRDALRWDGHVVSDCTALELMGDFKWDDCQPPYPPTMCKPYYFPGHNFTQGIIETTKVALASGTDANCGPLYRMWLSTLLANGSVPESAIDKSVTRILRSHVKLGLLDPKGPSRPYSQLGAADVDTSAHRQLALDAARESLVLLKNKNNTLPLQNQGRGIKLAFIGPHANATDSLLSNYHGENHLVYKHSPLAAALTRGLDVTYAHGCSICDTPTPNNFPCTTLHYDETGIPSAAEAAAAADVAVLFIGSDQTTEAENFDRQNITLAGVQELLLKAVLAANSKTIGVHSSQLLTI
jgi:beta-glucosidase-like glycosyl hydrolase